MDITVRVLSIEINIVRQKKKHVKNSEKKKI